METMRFCVKEIGQFVHHRTNLFSSISIALALLFTATIWVKSGTAASTTPIIAAGDTCASATNINPTALPFTEDTTSEGANNDIDPTVAGCVNGAGSDVVYAFTPATTGIYSFNSSKSNKSYENEK